MTRILNIHVREKNFGASPRMMGIWHRIRVKINFMDFFLCNPRQDTYTHIGLSLSYPLNLDDNITSQ